jgi:hypothetical protein
MAIATTGQRPGWRAVLVGGLLLVGWATLAGGGSATHPELLLGGYWNTDLSSGDEVRMAMLLSWPDSPGEVQLWYEGLPTGVTLSDDGTGGDLVAGDGLYGLSFGLTGGSGLGRVVLEAVAVADFRQSSVWPYLRVRDDVGPGCLLQTNQDGFGNRLNHYSWAMATFGDHLYVGTLNMEAGIPTDIFNPQVVNTEGAEVWRYDGRVWEQSAVRGFANHPDCFGIREMVEHEGMLYAGTAALEDGCEVWRTADGLSWEPAMTGGFGNTLNQSVRGMYSHDGLLYVGLENAADGAELHVWDGTEWTALMTGGFGNISNRSIAKIIFFREKLWLLLWNFIGYEIWTYDFQNFRKVVGNGAPVAPGNGDFLNQGVLSAAVYNDRLYIGTVNILTGADIYRTADGINWVQIADRGYDYHKQAYFWRMKEYRGDLYIGTYVLGQGTTTFQEACRLYKMDRHERLTQVIGPEGTLAPEGIVGDNTNYGVRSLEVFRDRLFIGTAQCFYCDGRPGTQVWAFDPDCR